MYYNQPKYNYKNLVVGANSRIINKNGRFVKAINFDNAATTPPFYSVMQQIINFSEYYSSIHRGTGFKSEFSSKIYEDSRKTICDFVHCDYEENTVIYVKNTTEAINKLSYLLYNENKDLVVLSTRMEHHSNDLPWRNKFNTDYIEVDELGKLKLEDLEDKLKKYMNKDKLVCVTGASNVTGYKNPIYKIAKLCHLYNAKILVDGAQLVPHCPIYMNSISSDDHIDYLVFSAHKMYAPFGIGVLIGPKETFIAADPEYRGGGTIKLVTDDSVVWADPPDKNEAGSPNVMGVVALLAAIRTLNSIGMENIDKYEMSIYRHALKRLKSIPNITIGCDTNPNCSKVAIIPFNIDGIFHETTAKLLSSISQISVRSGCFCAQPYVQRLLKISKSKINYYKNHPDCKRPGFVRLSFALYNTYSEIDVLADTLNYITKTR